MIAGARGSTFGYAPAIDEHIRPRLPLVEAATAGISPALPLTFLPN
jgi:hypothetical protein